MFYPAYVHLGEKHQTHGVTLPDFEGCFSAADNYADIPAKIQEAVELHFAGEDIEIPMPSEINQLEASGQYQGGIWVLVDLDISKLSVMSSD